MVPLAGRVYLVSLTAGAEHLPIGLVGPVGNLKQSLCIQTHIHAEVCMKYTRVTWSRMHLMLANIPFTRIRKKEYKT